jgi:transcriptional regulator with XRE-family HTH domain
MLLRHMADNINVRRVAARERLATNLKLFRGKLGMSQETLADRAGLHRTKPSEIERGLANVTLDTLVSLAEALGVDIGQLLAAHDESPTPLKSGRKADTEKAQVPRPRPKAV